MKMNVLQLLLPQSVFYHHTKAKLIDNTQNIFLAYDKVAKKYWKQEMQAKNLTAFFTNLLNLKRFSVIPNLCGFRSSLTIFVVT